MYLQLYDPTTGDYINQSDYIPQGSEYIYETYDTYDEESALNNARFQQTGQIMQSEEEPPSIPKTKKPKVNIILNYFTCYFLL